MLKLFKLVSPSSIVKLPLEQLCYVLCYSKTSLQRTQL